MPNRTTQPMLNWEPRAERPGGPEAHDAAGAPAACVVEPKPPGIVEALHRLNREQVIDEIISHNPSASVAFLDDFPEDRLRLYLTRLRASRRARGRDSLWIRTGESPAIVARERLL